MPLPTFLVIGSAKTGTTSLHSYLEQHPEVAMTTIKEPMCFVGDDWRQGIERYDELFVEDAPIRGESSTAYSAYPWAPEIPERVAATIPGARMVYLVRDPIPRLLSHYAQYHWDRWDVPPFDVLMEDLDDMFNMPVWASRYATQLERWLEHFPAERILVFEERDLRDDRVAAIQRVLEFIGADPTFSSPAWTAEHNTAGQHRVPNRLAHRLGRRFVAAAEAGRGQWLLTSEVRKPELTPEQRERVLAVLRPEAERLAALTGLSVDHWSLH